MSCAYELAVPSYSIPILVMLSFRFRQVPGIGAFSGLVAVVAAVVAVAVHLVAVAVVAVAAVLAVAFAVAFVFVFAVFEIQSASDA